MIVFGKLQKSKTKIKSINEEIKTLCSKIQNLKTPVNFILLQAASSTSCKPRQSSLELAPHSKEIELLICMDSNFNHIDYRKLWAFNKSERNRCTSLRDVENLIKHIDITNPSSCSH